MNKKDQTIKINLGCGKDIRKDWINLDAIAKFKPDVVHDLHKPLPFKDNYADYILAQDILEHFTREDLDAVLSDIARVLKIGGTLEVRVPNLEDIFERFEEDKETRNEFLYGTTFETGIFGAHKVGFTDQMLVALMMKFNLILEKLDRDQTNFVATFKKQKPSLEPKKLVYVNQTLGMGGAEVFMRDLLVGLKKNGWNVSVYTNNNRFKKILIKEGIKVGLIKTVVDVIGDWKGLVKGLILWPKLLLEYLTIINKEKDTDVFLMSGFIEKILFSPLAMFKNIPITWIEFGPMETIFAKFLRLPKVLYFLVKSIPQKVITSSYNSRNSLTSRARISLSKLRIIACGRNIKVKDTLKNEEENLVVCVSRLEAGKGQDLLVKAFAQVIKEVPKAKLKIVGEGDFKSIVEKEIKKYKLEKSVELVGRVKDSMVELAKAQVVVFPSVWPLEGFGLVMIEAMSLGKPVVAFDNGPVPEIIEDAVNGLLAKSHDTDHLAKQIITLLKTKKLRDKFSKQSKQDFKNKYQIEAVAQKYSQVLLEAINYHKAKDIVS
ncbi:MAG: glycosyltransferase [Candidatus Pacebacteria bacterium]|nr:glycosyltransferase [Candidatus Paceibacterota bacterium]